MANRTGNKIAPPVVKLREPVRDELVDEYLKHAGTPYGRELLARAKVAYAGLPAKDGVVDWEDE